MFANTAGGSSVAEGSGALGDNATGSNVPALGLNALANLAAGNTNLANWAQRPARPTPVAKASTSSSRTQGLPPGESNVLRIGTRFQSKAFVARHLRRQQLRQVLSRST